MFIEIPSGDIVNMDALIGIERQENDVLGFYDDGLAVELAHCLTEQDAKDELTRIKQMLATKNMLIWSSPNLIDEYEEANKDVLKELFKKLDGRK